jgi:hypothetical protein
MKGNEVLPASRKLNNVWSSTEHWTYRQSKITSLMFRYIYRKNKNCVSKPTEGESTPQYTKKSHMNIGLLVCGFQAAVSWQLQKMFKASTLSFYAGTAGEKTSGTLLCSMMSWLHLFTKVSHKTYFQSCCKMWICRVGIIYGSCMVVLHQIFFFLLGNSWTDFWNNGHDKVDQHHSLLLPLI